MNMDVNKFNPELESDLEPFGFIEDYKTVKSKYAGNQMLVSFGALNYLGHYAPEFGGVALVNADYNLFIAIKYIPWNANARKKEIEKQYAVLMENKDLFTPSDFTDYFYESCGYILPAQKLRLKEEYFLEIAQKDKERAENLLKAHNEIQEAQQKAYRGQITNLSRRKVEECRAKEEEKGYKPQIIDGEEMIPLDEDDEEDEKEEKK